MKTTNISEEGRRRQGIAGQRNLHEWQIREAQAQQAANEKVERFRREMTAEFNGNPSITERTLIDSAATSLLVITLAEVQLQQVPSRLKRKKGLAAAIAAHQNSLLRCIRALNAARRGKRPVPRTVAEIIAQDREEVEARQ